MGDSRMLLSLKYAGILSTAADLGFSRGGDFSILYLVLK